jgi:TPR repeat protein
LQLGDLYCGGLGIAEDLAIASTWYEKAAAQGNSEASTRLQALRSCTDAVAGFTNATG